METTNDLGQYYGDERLHGRVRYFITKGTWITSGCSEGLRTGNERVRFLLGTDDVSLIVGVDDYEGEILAKGDKKSGPERESNFLVAAIVLIRVRTLAGRFTGGGDICERCGNIDWHTGEGEQLQIGLQTLRITVGNRFDAGKRKSCIHRL